MERSYLFNIEKYKYIKSCTKDNCCILCSISGGECGVENLLLHKTALTAVTVNLYPYNPGHLMIFPLRHIEHYTEYSVEEAADIHYLTSKSIEFLDKEFNPLGYNVGYNIGLESGASIRHIHQHIVPRYKNEQGFMDILSGTRIIVNDPQEVHGRLKDYFLGISKS